MLCVDSLGGGAVAVHQTGHLLAIAEHLGAQCVDHDGHVRHAAELALQYVIGTQHRIELHEGHVSDDAGQVDRRLDAGVAAADHSHPLALVERAIAVRAVGDALVPVLLLAGHVHLAPPGAGGDDY